MHDARKGAYAPTTAAVYAPVTCEDLQPITGEALDPQESESRRRELMHTLYLLKHCEPQSPDFLYEHEAYLLKRGIHGHYLTSFDRDVLKQREIEVASHFCIKHGEWF